MNSEEIKKTVQELKKEIDNFRLALENLRETISFIDQDNTPSIVEDCLSQIKYDSKLLSNLEKGMPYLDFLAK